MTDDASIIARFAEQAGLSARFCTNAEQYYLPLANWLEAQVCGDRPIVAGINGAQGSGKTTLTKLLRKLLLARGKRVAALSLDDFYLPQSDRSRLAAASHPLLATRGVPGTHDIGLLAGCIDQLASATESTTVEWPLFDKASDDRARDTNTCSGAVDLIFVEGWCVGTAAEANERLQPPLNELERLEDQDGRWRRIVNEHLRTSYRDAWRRLDALCFLQVPDFNSVRRWRWQQEQELAARQPGHAIMTEDSLDRFLQHFERLTRHALRTLPEQADWLVVLNARHLCTTSRPR